MLIELARISEAASAPFTSPKTRCRSAIACCRLIPRPIANVNRRRRRGANDKFSHIHDFLLYFGPPKVRKVRTQPTDLHMQPVLACGGLSRSQVEMRTEEDTSALMGGRGGQMTCAWNRSILSIVCVTSKSQGYNAHDCAARPSRWTLRQTPNSDNQPSFGIQAAGPPSA